MVAASKMRSAQARTEQSRGMIAPLVNLLGDFPGARLLSRIECPTVKLMSLHKDCSKALGCEQIDAVFLLLLILLLF